VWEPPPDDSGTSPEATSDKETVMFKHIPGETLLRLHLDQATPTPPALAAHRRDAETPEKRPTIALIADRRACGKPW